MAEKQVEIFQEILASDRLGGFQNWNSYIVNNLGDDPTILWERIKWDPWTALAIFEDMEDKDSTLFSCLERRRDGVLALTRFVKPASDKRQDKKIAEFVEETLEQFWGGNAATLDRQSYESPFESFLDEALEAVGDGVTVGEIIFAESKDRIYIEEVKFKPQSLFAFGDTALASYSTASMMFPQTGRLRLRTGVLIEDYGMDKALPENKFFVFSYRSRKGNRWGMPVKRKCFWQTWIKRNGVKNWLRYVEKSSASVVAKYPGGSSEDEKTRAIEAATAVVEENAIAIPERFVLEVHEMVRNIGTSHKELVDDYCNAEISKAVVGQALTGQSAGGGGSRSRDEVAERVEHKKIEKDAKALMAVVNNRIIRPLVLYNFGPNAASPQWTLQYEETEDLNTMAERYSKLKTQVGLPLPKKHTYEVFQIPEPENDEDILGGNSVEEEKGKKGEKEKDVLDEETLEFAEKKKVSTRVRRQVELEDGTLQAIAPVYDSIFGRVIAELESHDEIKLPTTAFFNSLSDDFQSIDNLLADGILAAYLLGYDESSEENQSKIKAEFADDKRAEKAGPIDLRFDVPPAEAIDYFKRKKVVTKKDFNDLRDEAKATSFYISGVYQKDILEAFKMEIVDALETGKTQRETIKNFKNILSGAGHRELGDYHLESIFRTNMQMAYGIGRRRALESVAEDLPFWTYNAVNDDRTRPTHRVLDGITFPYDHEFWDTHYPPWGFMCRCSVTASYALPENYNPNNPSGLGEIAYDDKEMPVKAEYDTQVLDLTAGKFVGVKPQGRLSDLIDFAKLRGQKLNYPTPQAVIEEENRIRFDKHETVSFYDQDGNKLFTKTGEPDKIKFDLTMAEEKLLKYSTMTHNHPNTTFGEINGWQWKGVSFSLQDLEVATALDVAELRAVGNFFRYSLRPGKNGWSKKFKAELEAEYNKVRAKLYIDLSRKIPTGEVDFDYITGVIHHLIWEELAKKYKLRYKRIEN